MLVVVLAAKLVTCWTGNRLVETNYGVIKGVEAEADTWVWKGIPYAKPPVGTLALEGAARP